MLARQVEPDDGVTAKGDGGLPHTLEVMCRTPWSDQPKAVSVIEGPWSGGPTGFASLGLAMLLKTVA